MAKLKPKVLVTFDSMRDINCGYYSFGRGLGEALIAKNRDEFELSFYVFKNTPYTFGNKVKFVTLSILDKLWFSKKNDFDLIHFSDQGVRLKPSKVCAKKIMTVHDMNKVHLKYSKPARIEAYLKRMRRNIAQCDRIVAISEFVAEDLRHYFPEAAAKITVIYNGADKLQLPLDHVPVYKPQGKFLFTIGLLSKQKGFHHLPCLLVGNDFQLVIAGRETPHKEKIIEEAVKFGVDDRVIITGEISDDDKTWYYQNCSAFLFPSIAEGFGLPVIEAMHFGKPAFLSKYTSLPEVGGNVAYYFDSFEPAHMQSVFNNGMKDFKDHNRASEAIEQADSFSWTKAADQYLNLYRECLAGN